MNRVVVSDTRTSEHSRLPIGSRALRLNKDGSAPGNGSADVVLVEAPAGSIWAVLSDDAAREAAESGCLVVAHLVCLSKGPLKLGDTTLSQFVQARRVTRGVAMSDGVCPVCRLSIQAGQETWHCGHCSTDTCSTLCATGAARRADKCFKCGDPL